MLCGDVETNPGPNPGNEDVLSTVLATVQRIELGQNDIRSELTALKHWRACVDVELKQLSERIRTVEVDMAERKIEQVSAASESGPNMSGTIGAQLRKIESRCEDAENRLRRSNLLFFGIPDEMSETWSTAENKVINLCSEKLGVNLQSTQIERSHRLGQFQTEKCRPIIVKLTYFKDKQLILENGKKFKDTDYAVREDFSLQTRLARKKLLEFAKSKKRTYKLSVDKLRMGDSVYMYDSDTDQVIEVSR